MYGLSVIVPSWSYWAAPRKLQPLWELYYATLIEDRCPEASVDVVDLRLPDTQNSSLVVEERDVYFYWIMKSADANEIYDLVGDLRQKYRNSLHLAGGTHVENCPDECEKIFDSIFIGTAEEVIVGALSDWESGKLATRYRGSAASPFHHYGHARRSYLPSDSIVNKDHFKQHGDYLGTGAYFSRGCSFRCRFCVYNRPGKFEYRTGTQITSEINYLKQEYGVEAVNLRDEVCIPVNPKLAKEYLEAIGNAGVTWRGQTVPFGDEDMLRLARDSGCVELAIGVESADSDSVLEISNKPSKSLVQIRRYIELLKKYNIKVKVCLIMGLPGESENVLERTLHFLEEMEPDFVSVSAFDPIPGSDFFNQREEFGIAEIDDNLAKHSHLVYRYGDNEKVGLPFRYAEEAKWGRPLSRDVILENLKSVQSYLRDRNMVY